MTLKGLVLRKAILGLSSLVILAVMFFNGSIGHAATYFVAESGNDKNPGTQQEPWHSVRKAAATMQAGDVVIVQPGNYEEVVDTKRSGTRAAYITFQAAQGEVRLKAFNSKHDYIRLVGFTFGGQNPMQHGYIESSGNYCRIEKNVLRDGVVGAYGMRVVGSNSVIVGNRLDNFAYVNVSLGGTNNVFQDNSIKNTPHDAMRVAGRKNKISGNFFHNVSDSGVTHTDLWQAFSYGPKEEAMDITVENNFALDCNAQIAMLSDPYGKGLVRNWTFRNNLFINVANAGHICVPNVKFMNNTFVNCGKGTFGPILFRSMKGWGTASNAVITNNIFVGCGSRPENTGWYGTDKGLTVRGSGNFVAKGPSDSPPWGPKQGFKEPGGVNGGNPEFRNPDAHDYLPNPKGPARGKGARIVGVVR